MVPKGIHLHTYHMSGSFNDLFNDLSKSIGLVTFDMMYELKPVFWEKT